MDAVKIADGIYWVGAVDWNTRNFHGYATPRGTSYNAYLIVDEKVALIDCVKTPFVQQLISRIRSIIDPKKIDYIISNHSENDHSSGLPVLQQLTGAPILASRKGMEHLPLNYGKLDLRMVADGEELSLGRNTLKFIETPMLHWPDSMMTFVKEQGVLFSMDGFGQHFAASHRFDDEVDEATLFEEAAKYYANILLPFGGQYRAALEKLMGLDIRLIATAHGIIWRKHIAKIIETYGRWAEHSTRRKAVIIYDTMWGSTESMAIAIAEGIASTGAEVQICKASATDRSTIVREVLDSKALVFGSPTLNMGAFPTMADIAIYLKGLKPRNRYAGFFGSYGWVPGGVKAMKELLANSGLEFKWEDLDIRFNPMEEGRRRCYDYGVSIGRTIMSEQP
ncbi:MAG: Type A flavoprotein FprA [Methanomassiliicoccales archaeon PtaU1.Bin124]|nr:MAG: Type A flavoprotein FprA [Methanomassiliicoccales archaeon PtaU1.Bin124]